MLLILESAGSGTARRCSDQADNWRIFSICSFFRMHTLRTGQPGPSH